MSSVRAVKAAVWFLLLCAAGFGTIVRRSGTHCGGLGGQGIVVGLGIGALLAFTVVQQPRSPELSGLELAWSLVWLGVIYGLLDGLLLTVAQEPERRYVQ